LLDDEAGHSRRRTRYLPENCEPFAVSREEAAGLWNVSPTLFDALIQEGIVPPPLRIHGRVVWDMRSLKAAWRKFADSHSTDPEVNP
jgi:hypothetical protein